MKAFLVLCLMAVCAHADVFNLTVNGVTNTTYSVPSNVVAKVTYVASAGNAANIRVTIGTNFVSPAFVFSGGTFVQTNLPTVVGPAAISLINTSGGSSAWSYCVIETSPASPTPVVQTPSNAVVIPCDNNGPVTIILESSVDLVNWTAALPGTYGTTESNRFFRVRASR